jgi:fructokinase
MSQKKPSVVCFGEILWDVLPHAAMPGGAPMNVAYHLNKLGVETTLVSRVGKDEPGDLLLDLLRSWGLTTDFCQVDASHDTSKVLAVLGEHHEVSYDIVFPVAWDYISYQSKFKPLLHSADALVFGSLITRNATSCKTLYAMLEEANYKVFDMNLRAPHYSPLVIYELLSRTNLLKLNESELSTVAGWFDPSVASDADCVRFFQDKFNIQEILVTRGSKGATYYTPLSSFDHAAYKVKVADTIGSGDSFLAGFLAKRLQRECADAAVSFAAALGAFVTQHHGACPDYTIQELEQFKSEKEMDLLFSQSERVQLFI